MAITRYQARRTAYLRTGINRDLRTPPRLGFYRGSYPYRAGGYSQYRTRIGVNGNDFRAAWASRRGPARGRFIRGLRPLQMTRAANIIRRFARKAVPKAKVNVRRNAFKYLMNNP